MSGEPMNNNTPYFWLGEFCEKHDLPFYGLHSFRHLFASLLVNQGVDIVTVSGALGHSTVSTTSNIYCHILQEAQAKVSTAVSSALDFNTNKKRAGSIINFDSNENNEQTKNNSIFEGKRKTRKRRKYDVSELNSW